MRPVFTVVRRVSAPKIYEGPAAERKRDFREDNLLGPSGISPRRIMKGKPSSKFIIRIASTPAARCWGLGPLVKWARAAEQTMGNLIACPERHRVAAKDSTLPAVGDKAHVARWLKKNKQRTATMNRCRKKCAVGLAFKGSVIRKPHCVEKDSSAKCLRWPGTQGHKGTGGNIFCGSASHAPFGNRKPVIAAHQGGRIKGSRSSKIYPGINKPDDNLLQQTVPGTFKTVDGNIQGTSKGQAMGWGLNQCSRELTDVWNKNVFKHYPTYCVEIYQGSGASPIRSIAQKKALRYIQKRVQKMLDSGFETSAQRFWNGWTKNTTTRGTWRNTAGFESLDMKDFVKSRWEKWWQGLKFPFGSEGDGQRRIYH